jgi:hypothetical protein
LSRAQGCWRALGEPLGEERNWLRRSVEGRSRRRSTRRFTQCSLCPATSLTPATRGLPPSGRVSRVLRSTGLRPVLIGSTEKLGVGTNVQARLVALHHLDCPWRPADIEQREGRGIRQGNQNREVEILRYVTEGSFDAYLWQTVERKAGFIAQVTRGDVTERDVDDVADDAALSYAEVKALASGSPIIIEKAGIDAEVARLGRLERAHEEDQRRLRRALATAEHRAGTCDIRVARLAEAIEGSQDTRGDRFRMTIEDTVFTKRPEAGRRLQVLMSKALTAVPEGTTGEERRIGVLGGLEITAVATKLIAPEVVLRADPGGIEVLCSESDVRHGDPVGLIQRIERRIQTIPQNLEEATREGDSARAEAVRAAARIDLPFEYSGQLRDLRRRQREIHELLTLDDPETPPPHVVAADMARSRLDAVTPRGVVRSL